MKSNPALFGSTLPQQVSTEEIEVFKGIAKQSEMRAFDEIVTKLIKSRGDLEDVEIAVVREELQA